MALFVSSPIVSTRVTVAILTATGVVANYNDLPTALVVAAPTDTVLVRGAVPGGMTIVNPCQVDASGANVGTAQVSLGPLTPGTVAQNTTLMGLRSGGRVVAMAQNDVTYENNYVFSDLNLSGAAHLEFFSVGANMQGGLSDNIELRNIVFRKTALHGTGYLGDPLFVIQSRNIEGDHPVRILVGSGCDLQNDVGPIFGGYANSASIITLQGRCRLSPGYNRRIQEVYTVPGGATMYTNAQILNDQRTSFVPIAVNQYGAGKPTRALLTQNDFDAYLLGGTFTPPA